MLLLPLLYEKQVHYVSCPMLTDLLSPNKYDFVLIGTPKYLKVCLKSIICSVAVLDATNSDPYVAVSTVACLFEY